LPLGFLQNVGTENLLFSSCTPKQWSLASMTI
jgi:hypothetical protein